MYPRDDNSHVTPISVLALPGNATPDALVDRPSFGPTRQYLSTILFRGQTLPTGRLYMSLLLMDC